MKSCLVVLIALSAVAAAPPAAEAQTPPSVVSTRQWDITVYPLFVWIPLFFDIDIVVPPDDGDSGGAGDILDGRFDGAFLGGVTAANGPWRIEGFGVWAALGGDRPELPFLTVDLDVIAFEARVGRRVAGDVFVTGGVRRLALNYDIVLGNLPRLEGKPGMWDPLVGVGWHRPGRSLEWHASFEAGGFGVGSDLELAGDIRLDWKPTTHFGLSGGYSGLYIKSSKVTGRDVSIKGTFHGPVFGLGLYF